MAAEGPKTLSIQIISIEASDSSMKRNWVEDQSFP